MLLRLRTEWRPALRRRRRTWRRLECHVVLSLEEDRQASAAQPAIRQTFAFGVLDGMPRCAI